MATFQGNPVREVAALAVGFCAESVSRFKRRLIAHVEVMKRAERGQVADIDKRIVWHQKPLFVGLASALVRENRR